MAVDEHRIIGRDGIDPFLCGKTGSRLTLCPVLLVPVSAEDPLTFGRFLCLVGDAADELILAARIVKLYLVELHPTRDEVNMRIVESGQQQLTPGIDHSRLRAPPGIDLCAPSDSHNAITNDRYRLRPR